MHRIVLGDQMNETLGAIVAGITLVLLSMLGGGILYVLFREHVIRKIFGGK
jgi:hypothetical protein